MVAAIALTIGSVNAVDAQTYPPPRPGGPGNAGYAGPPSPYAGPQRDARGFWPRRGMYGGVGLGFGSMTWDCAGCDETSYESLGFHFNVGFRFTPQLALFLDGWGLGTGFDEEFLRDSVLVHAVSTFGVHYWITPVLHAKLGIGGAQWSLSNDQESAESDVAPAFLLAAGYEILTSPNFSIDLEVRLGAGNYDDQEDGGRITNFGIQFSVNFHQLWRSALLVVH